jgi:ElaB/YqjD/DUF883 family membrane-anchored ribosome-binding protein
MADTQAAKDKLMEDFSAVINDSQELLKAMGAASGDRAASLRGDLDRKLRQARERLDEMQGAALERGREAARQADEYVHDNPVAVDRDRRGCGRRHWHCDRRVALGTALARSPLLEPPLPVPDGDDRVIRPDHRVRIGVPLDAPQHLLPQLAQYAAP